MDREQLVNDLATRFNGKKTNFLTDVRSAVNGYISSQGTGCLTLIEKKRNGTKEKWELSPHPGYALRLIAFCRGKKYEGNEIDSGLTEPVIGIVTRQFEHLYQANDEEIAKTIMSFIIQNQVLSASLVDTVINSAAVGKITDEVKARMASLILSQVQDALQVALAKGSLVTVGKTVTAVASKPIAAKIAMMLVKFIAVHLKTVIAKVLASAAIKTIIAAAVKKFLVAALTAAIVKAIAAKFGISAGAVFLWILIPVIVAYIAYEVVTFPGHLGEKVSEKVVEDLSGKFTNINQDVFKRVVSEVIDNGFGAIIEQFAQSDEVQDAIGELVASLR